MGHSRSAPWWYIAGSGSLGLALGMAGPSLSMLKHQTGTSTGQIGVIFTAGGFGYLLASQSTARGYDRGWGHRLQGPAMLCAAAAFASIPFTASLTALVIAFVASGIAVGTVDIGSNTQMLWARGERAGPWLAALHLAFGAGALVSPLISRLSEATLANTRLAYGVPAAAIIVVGLGMLSTHGPQRAAAAPSGVPRPIGGNRRGLLWFAVFIFLYTGGEVGFASWINTYARGIGDSPGAAALLNSAFWASFTTGRLVNLWISRKVTEFHVVIAMALVAAGAAAVLLTLDPGAAWFAVVALGVTIGPMFPLTLALIGQRVELSGGAVGRLIGASGVGGLTWPWVIGRLIDGAGPRALPSTIVLLFVAAAAMSTLGARNTASCSPPRSEQLATA
jgi:fucose permease